MKAQVMEIDDEWMPKNENAPIDLPKTSRRVDEEVQAKEEELEYAKQRGDPTALWRALSTAAEKGMVRRLAGGRGSHKTADYRQIVTVERSQTFSDDLAAEVREPTARTAASAKAERRLANREGIW